MLANKKWIPWAGLLLLGALAFALGLILFGHRSSKTIIPALSPIGQWRAVESDDKFVSENNPCVLTIYPAGSNRIRVTAVGATEQWQSDGSGTFDGLSFTFELKGRPKGWSGSFRAMVMPDGKTFTGTYTRPDSKETFHCKGHRMQ